MSNHPEQEDWVVVFVSGDIVEAELVKGILEHNDIDVLLRSSQISPFPETIGATGQTELIVRFRDKASAEEIIRESQHQ